MGWHIPAVFALGLHSETWHAIEQASFFVAGLLFWWPVIQPWPSVAKWPEWSMLLYLFFATVPCDILSGLLVFGDRVVYPVYSSSLHLFNLSALEDQQCAAALMWTAVTVIYLVVGTIFAARLLSPRISHSGELEPSASFGHAMPQPDPHSLEVAWHGH
jgi:cytochrome c oxidase assembly factor CtaG